MTYIFLCRVHRLLVYKQFVVVVELDMKHSALPNYAYMHDFSPKELTVGILCVASGANKFRVTRSGLLAFRRKDIVREPDIFHFQVVVVRRFKFLERRQEDENE